MARGYLVEASPAACNQIVPTFLATAGEGTGRPKTVHRIQVCKPLLIHRLTLLGYSDMKGEFSECERARRCAQHRLQYIAAR